MGIPLLTGRPQDGWASFSRFVLPFAYRLERRATRDLCALLPALQSESGSWDHLARWEAVDLDEPFGDVDLRTRVDYYTAETAEVLFGKRTRRFRLRVPQGALAQCPVVVTKHPPEPRQWAGPVEHDEAPRPALTVTGFLQPPELMLFEFDVHDDDPDSPLHMGLLIHTVYFDAVPAAKVDPPRPDTHIDSALLFAFNECFRNTRRPFADYPYTLDVSGVDWLQRIVKRCESRDCSSTCAESGASHSQLWLDPLDAPIQIDGEPWQLYSAEAATQARHPDIGLDTRVRNPMIHADYRTHTWTAAVSAKGGSDLRGDGAPAAHSQGWLRLLNIDGPGPAPDQSGVWSDFQRKWLDEHTYMRWADGSLYGFTPHSGAAWLPDTRTWDDKVKLHQHFHTLYFDQLTLMLYLRSALFGFSREISLLTRRMQRRETDGVQGFSRLEHQFSVFTNLYQFPLLSHQQQALEMYDCLRRSLDIDDFYEEVQDELRHMAETFDRRHDRIVREIGIAFAVLASAGVIWDNFNLSDALGKSPSFGAVMASLAAIAAALWGGVRLYLRCLRWRP